MEKTKTRVAAYIRVSSADQADSGFSLDAQRAKLEGYALALDLELVAVHVDAGVSAKNLKRPGLRAALADLDGGRADGLLICKLDRLTRSVRDLGTLVADYFERRFDLMSVADSIDTRSAGGKLVLNVLTSVAQWEREATGERTREVLQHLKRQGVKLGGAALGWRRVDDVDTDGRKVMADVEKELATVARIVELRADGLTLRAIAAQLESEGHRTKKGLSKWSGKVVLSALNRVRA